MATSTSLTFTPVSTSAQRTLAEQAVAALYDRIMSGELAPGSALRLSDLAIELEMSHSPVREALRRLENIGLVEVASHKGARVRDISLEDFEDTQRTRMSLESLAIELAAPRFADADAFAAEEALGAHATHLADGDPIASRRAHTLFHFALYRASGSNWLLNAIQPVWENSERYRFATRPDPTQIDETHYEHRAILDACIDHDILAATEAIRRHIFSATERMRPSVISRIAAQEGVKP